MTYRTAPVVPESENQPVPLYAVIILLIILFLAAALRIYKLGQSPPGLNQDEAVNAWNAYCLLKTGADQFGVSWPIFYMRALGGNNSTLFIYSLIPFQALGGMNIFTTRLPGALAGILTVFLIYFTAKRLFNWQSGLIAAALLAIDPWNLQQSRWGHEVTIAALAGLLPVALMLWARMPIRNDTVESPLPLRAFFAGALTAIVCYGYHSIRIFVPLFLFSIVLVTLPAWWNQLKNKKGLTAIAAYAVGFFLFFGPLVYQHIFHPEGIARHALYNKLWTGSESLWFKIQTILVRYIIHFGPDFLFVHGNQNIRQSPPGMGMFYWYMLPLMVIGLAWAIYKFRRSYSARLVLIYVLCYPTGDSFFSGTSLHVLRSFAGSCGLVLVAAIGAFFAADYLLKRSRAVALILIAIFVVAAVYSNVQYLNRFFVKFNRHPDIYLYFHTDFVDAMKWLKPRLKDSDLVFCTTKNLNNPYVLSLVLLDYDPHKAFSGPREIILGGESEEWDYCKHFNNMYFMYDNSYVPAIKSAKDDTLLYLIIRPGEFPLKPVYRAYMPDGSESLWICAVFKNAFGY